MNRLPAEILPLILSRLEQRDKVKCMTVCRDWHATIQNILFRVIHIHHPKQFEKLLERVEKHPSLGAQAEELILQALFRSECDENILFERFPNLRHAVLVFYDDKADVMPRQHHPWCDRMESMLELWSDFNTKKLLLSGICKKLTSIAVTPRSPGSETATSFIKALVNAPALERLELKGYVASINDFELLHLKSSSLRELSLDSIRFEHETAPLRIKPSTSVRKFRNWRPKYDNCIKWNQYTRYFSQKYTQLEDLMFEIGRFNPNNEDLAESWSTISTHLKTLGTQLKTLTIHYLRAESRPADILNLDILDKYSCAINKFELISNVSYPLFKQLSTTTQVRYIQSLTIDNKNAKYDYDFIDWEWLKEFTMLKELILDVYSISGDKIRLCLGHLLNLLGGAKLENLKVRGLDLYYDDKKYKTTPVYPSLKQLDFTFDPTKDMDTFVSRAFPNLKRLVLVHWGCLPISFKIPDLNLIDLEFDYDFIVGNDNVLVITDTQQRLYSVDEKIGYRQNSWFSPRDNVLGYAHVSSAPYNNLTDDLGMTVICKSVRNVTIKKAHG